MRTSQKEIRARKSVLATIMFGRGRQRAIKGGKGKVHLSYKVLEKKVSSSPKKQGMFFLSCGELKF